MPQAATGTWNFLTSYWSRSEHKNFLIFVQQFYSQKTAFIPISLSSNVGIGSSSSSLASLAFGTARQVFCPIIQHLLLCLPFFNFTESEMAGPPGPIITDSKRFFLGWGGVVRAECLLRNWPAFWRTALAPDSRLCHSSSDNSSTGRS